MRVEEVAKELDVSRSYAYKIVQRLNSELEEQGFLTISGRVNRKYFMKKFCYGGTEKE
jgi:predicted transcriptional regulator